MCGRVFVKSSPVELLANFAFARRTPGDGLDAYPRFNGAPGLVYPIIVREPDAPGGMFVSALWGIIPRWDPKRRRQINARDDRIMRTFPAAYRSRRALMPIDGFFEWRSTKGPRRPYAIAMKDDKPYAVAAIWEETRDPRTDMMVKTFAVITCPANELVGQIHDRMPVIIGPEDYTRWLSDIEPDPRDLLRPYPAELMRMWPVSTRVNKTAYEAPDILDPEVEPDLFGSE